MSNNCINCTVEIDQILQSIFPFNCAWRKMEKCSHCDTIYGAEYRRVFKEWILADYPDDVEAFIIKAANLKPLRQ